MIKKTVSDTKQVANTIKEGNQAVVEGKKIVNDTFLILIHRLSMYHKKWGQLKILLHNFINK